MLNVLSGGVTDRLVEDIDYQKQELVFSSNGAIINSSVMAMENNQIAVSLSLPFFIDQVPAIETSDCFAVEYETGLWKRVLTIDSVSVSNNVVNFIATCEESIKLYGLYLFMVRSRNLGYLKLTWGGNS